jgi:hypothetical protein
MSLNLKNNEQPIHWPTLNTVIMVEKIIESSEESILTIPEIKKRLPRQVNHNTLMVILKYLEESNKIIVTLRGITWIHNTNSNLKEAIGKGMEL